jgi:hypothetical protein
LNRTVIICGVPPVRSIGAGRLAIELEQQAKPRPDVRLLFAGNRSTVADAVRRRRWAAAAGAVTLHVARRARQRVLAAGSSLHAAESVILLHPQSIGGRWSLDLIRRRRQPTWIYLLDSSFFCLRSYNHLATEHDACLRCVGGAWSAAVEHDCTPYPAGHDCDAAFLEELRALAADGRVRFMAQNPGQAVLAERHFGPRWPVPVVGMWTIDLGEVFGGPSMPPLQRHDSGRGYDVVFHGGDHHAKGFFWALDVARRLPAVQFLFPMAWRTAAGWGERPANCEFRPMSWESGLHDAVSAAAVTLVPSLWSAPVEGAMVKSIAVGRAVAAPSIQSGFVADLPAGLVRLLGSSPEAAAADLERLLAEGWQPDAGLLAGWKQSFQAANSPLLDSMIRATISATLPSP